MNLLKRIEENQPIYEKNKKEILTKLIKKDYNEKGRLLIASAIDEAIIYEFELKYLEKLPIETLNVILDYVIGYRFTTY